AVPTGNAQVGMLTGPLCQIGLCLHGALCQRAGRLKQQMVVAAGAGIGEAAGDNNEVDQVHRSAPRVAGGCWSEKSCRNALKAQSLPFILPRMERPAPQRSRLARRAFLASLGGGLAELPRVVRAQPARVEIGYLRWLDPRPVISLLDKPAQNDGLAGASLALNDNNTTGAFT